VTRSSADFRFVEGKLVKQNKRVQTRGLNQNYNHRLKRVFKSAALGALREKKIHEYYERLRSRGLSDELARVQVARKLSAIVLAVWKSKEEFDEERVMAKAA
jgi:hypothetical protein